MTEDGQEVMATFRKRRPAGVIADHPPSIASREVLAAGRRVLSAASDALLDERRLLTEDELVELAALPDGLVGAMAALAHQVRLDRCGPEVSVEGIVSAKTGACPEDCHFCSQSASYPTTVKATPFLSDDEIFRAADEARAAGAAEFCLVLAVRGPDERTMQRLEHIVPAVAAHSGLRIALSAGILSAAQATRLAESGVYRYNHNLETARSNMSSILSTHSFDDRVATCKFVREAGMELCCGALIGMGESDLQRVELLMQLRDLDPVEVPINFLNPRPGTPLESEHVLGAWEAIRWIALFRLALPSVTLRYGGGREITLRELQAMGLTSGVNALIIGNYLTTLGRSPEEDVQMLEDLAMPMQAIGAMI
jgi:biotin synthase